MGILVSPHTFTVYDYHRMGEAGILLEDDRVELIEGELVDMAPIGNRHNAAVDRINELFVHRLAGTAIVRVQGSVRLNERNEPQPDIVVLHRRDDFYAATAAGPDDILLMVEVADSSLAYDREVKASLYARTRVSEYWLVDLEARSIAIYREPGPAGYRTVTMASGKEVVSPQLLSDLSVAPDEVIP